jgi:hypothetical protein
MPTSRSLLAATAALVAAGAILPAAGSAGVPAPPKRVAYDIEIAALGSYKSHDRFGTLDDPAATTNTLNFDFSYTSTYQDVVFADGRLESVRIAPEQDAAIAVHDATIEHRNAQGAITDTVTCKTDPRIDIRGTGSLEKDLIAGIGSELLLFRPADAMAASLDCDDADPASDHEGSHLGVDLAQWGWSATGPAELGEGPLDMNFDLPFEALGKDYIEHPVDPAPEQLAGSHCPGWSIGVTQSCTLEWTGTVRMTKADLPAAGDQGAKGDPVPVLTEDDLPPLPGTSVPAPPSRPGPAPTPSPAGGRGGPSVGTPRVGRDRRHVTVTVSCPGVAPCTGTARPQGSKAQRFAVAAGRSKAITVTLPRRLRRGATATISVAVTPKGGQAVRRTLRAR